MVDIFLIMFWIQIKILKASHDDFLKYLYSAIPAPYNCPSVSKFSRSSSFLEDVNALRAS